MIYVKCVDVDSKKQEIQLQDGDNNRLWVKKKVAIDKMLSEEVDIINMIYNTEENKLQFTKTGYYRYKYEKLASKGECSEKAKKAFIKSQMLGSCPEMEYTARGEQYIPTSKYQELILTDMSTGFSGNINAHKITFIGNLPLRVFRGKSTPTRIYCDEAIVMNKCIMANIGSDGGSNYSHIKVLAKRLEIKHDFISTDTAREVWDMYVNDRAKRKSDDLQTAKVYFNHTGVDLDKVIKEVRAVVRHSALLEVGMRAFEKGLESKPYNNLLAILTKYENLLLYVTSMRISTDLLDNSLLDIEKQTNERINALSRCFHQKYVMENASGNAWQSDEWTTVISRIHRIHSICEDAINKECTC